MNAVARLGCRLTGVLILAAVASVGVLAALPGEVGAVALVAGVDDTVSAPPEPTTPETTPPETTPPSETTPPPSTEPGVAPPPSIAEPEPDSGTTTAILVIGIVATLALLALAMWWMLHREEPTSPPTDPDWPDRSEVL